MDKRDLERISKEIQRLKEKQLFLRDKINEYKQNVEDNKLIKEEEKQERLLVLTNMLQQNQWILNKILNSLKKGWHLCLTML